MINEETETQIKQDMDNIKSFLDEIFYSIMGSKLFLVRL